MKNFLIDELFGENWNTAIQNVINVLNKGRSEKLFYQRDKFYVEDVAMALGLRFTVDGEIAK